MSYGIQVLVFVIVSFALCWLGKAVYHRFHARVAVDRELTAKDNVAFAVPLGAYYLGILLVLGGPLSSLTGPAGALDVLAVAGWGLLAVVLLNVSLLADKRTLFGGLDLDLEVFERNNLAVGIVVAGSYIANAQILLGAFSEEGGFLPGVVFWLYAQALLGFAAHAYPRLTGFDLKKELRKGNRAVALSFAGLLVAMGNVLRMSITGAFSGWSAAFAATTTYALAGLVLLLAVRELTDWLLLPGVTIREEILEQEVPNIGVGYLVGLFYLGASFLIGWCL